MQCPNCQADNRDERKFCGECGTKLIPACPECGFENLPTEKFCGDCGHNLTQPSPAIPKELSFDEKIAKIQKYLPSGITEKILSQRNKIEGEKRQVTVMFCDMKGFTPLGGAYSVYGGSCYHKGLFDEAKTHLLEWAFSYEKAAPVGWIGWAYAYLGSMHIDLREYEEISC